MAFRLCAILLFIGISLQPILAQDIQSPEDALGFQVGADYKLARWEQIVNYFNRIGEQSPRVKVEEIGRTTENNSYILATVSTPETINRIRQYQTIQRKISHPNEIGTTEKEQILTEAKTVVLISCALHSTEIASSQMAMELVYELATKNDPKTMEILENTIVLIVPSANPDGINKVIDWYQRSLGKPWEGRGMPWLYQKYCGHDDNRDWFMLTQKETQILTKTLYQDWYPTIIYDIHQMGNQGCRFFVPPFYDPISPNVDPLIHETLKIIGGHISTDLAAQGKKGVISNAIYDNWWHGGNRTTPYRHNIVGILTEAASPRIASPIFQHQSQLSGHSRGLPKYRPQVNFADPWPGGWWRLRDVVEYEKIACYSLFTLAARYRESFNRNYLALGEKAIRLGTEEPPFAFLIPRNQRDLPTAVHLLDILHQGGIDVHTATEPFTANGVIYEAGTFIIYAAQPYRNHLRDLLEPQLYPDRSQYPGGPAETPYDIAGWTLSYQMGVNAISVARPFDASTQKLSSIPLPPGELSGSGHIYISTNKTNNDFRLLNRVWDNEISVMVLEESWERNGETYAPGSLVYATKRKFEKDQIKTWSLELGLNLFQTSSSLSSSITTPLEKPRIALYQPWTASMDEGWTRFVLEQFEFDYASVHNSDIRAGNLNSRFDVLIIPDLSTHSILNGRAESTIAPEYVGGIGKEGVDRLRDFVTRGGTLLCLDSSSLFAINYFDLPVKNVLSGLKRSEFYCPGSILRINLDPTHPLAYGMERSSAAFFGHSLAFELTNPVKLNTGISAGQGTFAATYDKALTLMSGWLKGENRLQNKCAVASVPYGEGNVVLYGFRVQHRAQTHATFRLLFNGIVFGGLE